MCSNITITKFASMLLFDGITQFTEYIQYCNWPVVSVFAIGVPKIV